ncbi:MAG: ABC transporter ATP-binding protein [Gemmatimonadota bacterium]
MTAISVDGVSYRYQRGVDALHDVTFEAPPGAILGLLGANGAGKTTLLQCCAGLRQPTAGHVRIGGERSERRVLIVRGVVGYVAAGVELPRDLTLRALERWIAPLHRRWDTALATQLRERFALDASRRLTSFSRGETMKAALLCALAAQPRVLLMDEPLSGIDAVSRDEITRGLIANAAATGTTVLIASHDIAEIESVLSDVAILGAGRVQVAGSLEQLQTRYRRITLLGGDAILGALAREQAWLEVSRAGRMLSIVADTERTPLDAAMLRRRYEAADSLTVEDMSLRDVFSSVVRTGRVVTATTEAA